MGVPVGVFSVEPVRRGVLESLGELVRVPPSVTVTVGDAVEEGDAVEDAEAVTEKVKLLAGAASARRLQGTVRKSATSHSGSATGISLKTRRWGTSCAFVAAPQPVTLTSFWANACTLELCTTCTTTVREPVDALVAVLVYVSVASAVVTSAAVPAAVRHAYTLRAASKKHAASAIPIFSVPASRLAASGDDKVANTTTSEPLRVREAAAESACAAPPSEKVAGEVLKKNTGAVASWRTRLMVTVPVAVLPASSAAVTMKVMVVPFRGTRDTVPEMVATPWAPGVKVRPYWDMGDADTRRMSLSDDMASEKMPGSVSEKDTPLTPPKSAA